MQVFFPIGISANDQCELAEVIAVDFVPVDLSIGSPVDLSSGRWESGTVTCSEVFWTIVDHLDLR